MWPEVYISSSPPPQFFYLFVCVKQEALLPLHFKHIQRGLLQRSRIWQTVLNTVKTQHFQKNLLRRETKVLPQSFTAWPSGFSHSYFSWAMSSGWDSYLLELSPAKLNVLSFSFRVIALEVEPSGEDCSPGSLLRNSAVSRIFIRQSAVCPP